MVIVIVIVIVIAAMGKPYLRIGTAKDLSGKERVIYRVLEILPGALVWSTFLIIIIGSRLAPFWVAVFIIAFDLYWLLRSVYHAWHLRASFRVMREYMRMDWAAKLDGLDLARHPLGVKNWKTDIWHLIILPYYTESYEILRKTCEMLAETPYPQGRMMVVLSGEERAGEVGRAAGERVAAEFGPRFGRFLLTFHPDLPGELAGKGANETWAARQAKEKIIDSLGIPEERIIVSVFDVDTLVSAQYFPRLTYCYLTAARPLRTSYQPVPLFINNIWEAPALARVIAFSSTFWHLMNQMRPERLVSFSSHAFPYKALRDLGFWQTNVVSEDSRIFWQGLLTFDGDWRVAPLLIPISMDANVAETTWRTMKNLYLQQRRWAYGVADIPYFLYGFWRNKNITRRAKAYWAFHMLESFWAWPTNSLMIFALGWLPVLIGGSAFGITVLAYNTPRLTRWILTAAMFGIITSIYLSLILLPPRPVHYGRYKYALMALQWLLIPITLIIFGSFPAIEAETRLMLGRYLGFWSTPKVRKGVQKEVFAKSPLI